MLKLILALSKTSRIANIHPAEKMMLSLFPIVVIGFTHKAAPIILNIIIFIILHILCKNNKQIVTKFTLEIGTFAAFSSITLIFNYGWKYCFIILLKSLSAGLCLAFFSLTTPIDDSLHVFSKFNCLKDICDIAKTMERFLIVIDDERHIIYNSIKSRGGFDGFKLKIVNTGKMAGLLFVNTMNRWQNIKEAIESRGYRGYMPYLDKNFDFSRIRFFLINTYLLSLILIIYMKL